MAETQRVCNRCWWLLRYFELYGDDSPNKDEVMIQVMLKKQVYEHYNQMISQGREFVGLERFYDIWNVIYPKHRLRSYCDIKSIVYVGNKTTLILLKC